MTTPTDQELAAQIEDLKIKVRLAGGSDQDINNILTRTGLPPIEPINNPLAVTEESSQAPSAYGFDQFDTGVIEPVALPEPEVSNGEGLSRLFKITTK